MRLTLMAAAIGLLLHAVLLDPGNLPYAIITMVAVILYEGLYHAASYSIQGRVPAVGAKLSH